MDIRRLATPEEWTARGAENLPGVIGIVFEKVEPTEVIARVAIRKALMAPNGYLHAGTVVTLADTCCGYGTRCASSSRPRCSPTTTCPPSTRWNCWPPPRIPHQRRR